MTTITYQLTRTQLEACRVKLAAMGVNLLGDQGDVTHGGVDLGFKYTEPSLVVTIVNGGGYPGFLIKHKLNDWFKET